MSPIYLDTNAIVQLVERRDAALRSYMIRANAAGRRFVTSEITLAELLVKPLGSGDLPLCETYELLLSEAGLVTAHPVDRSILRKSAEIRATFRGSLPDTVHIATAMTLGCKTMISSDQRMRVPDGISRIGTDALPTEVGP